MQKLIAIKLITNIFLKKKKFNNNHQKSTFKANFELN